MSYEGYSETLVGYFDPNADELCDHDDNCRIGRFVCANGHPALVAFRRTCPNPDCDWKGKLTCFCHDGTKIEADPEDLLVDKNRKEKKDGQEKEKQD